MKSENKPMRGYVAVLVIFALVVVGIFGYRGYIHYRETHPVWPSGELGDLWEELGETLPRDATMEQLEERGYRYVTQIQPDELQEVSEFLDPTKETGKRLLILSKDTEEEGPVLLVLQRSLAEKLVALDTYVVQGQYSLNPGTKYKMKCERVEEDGVTQVWLRWHRIWSDEPEQEDYLLYSYRSAQ